MSHDMVTITITQLYTIEGSRTIISYLLWQPLDTKSNSQSPIATQASKALSRQLSEENHKRTQQGVSTKLESYIYTTCLVHATNN